MLTLLGVMVIEIADSPWAHRLTHCVHRKTWILQTLHQTPEPHLWLSCWGWRMAEHSSRVYVRLDLSLGGLLHGVRAVIILEYGNRGSGSGSHCGLCVPSLVATAKKGPRGIMRHVVSIRLRLRLDRDTTMLKRSRCGGCSDIPGVPERPGRYASIHCRRLMPGLQMLRNRRETRGRRTWRLCLWMWRWLSLFE